MRILAGFLLTAAVLSSGFAQAGTIRDDRSTQSYLSLAAQTKYDSVGFINEFGSPSNLIASGVLIAPNVVLTAAHVVEHANSITFKVNGTTYSDAEWLANPNWTGNLSTGYDLGLIRLTAAVTNVAPAVRYTGSDEIGAVGTYVGYGKSGTGITGANFYDGAKRAGTNMIDGFYSANPRLLVSDFDNPNSSADNSYGSRVPTNLEYMIAQGDSGGGLFIDTALGTRLVGINSFSAAPDGNNNDDYGDVSGAVRLTQFNSWIDGIVQQYTAALGLSANSLDNLTVAVPEPSSLALSTFGFLTLIGICWRRRSA